MEKHVIFPKTSRTLWFTAIAVLGLCLANVGCTEPTPTPVSFVAPTPQPTVTDTVRYDTMQVESIEDTVGEFPVYDLVQIGTSEVGATVQSNKIVYEYSKVPENIDLRFKDGILYQVIFDKKAVEERHDATNVRLLLNPKRVKVLGKRVTTSFISRYYGVPLSKIKEYNPNMDINRIKVGQIINLECNCNFK